MTRGQLHTLVVISRTMNHKPAAISLPFTFFGFAAVIYLAVFIIPVALVCLSWDREGGLFLCVVVIAAVCRLFVCLFVLVCLLFAERFITKK